MKKAMLLLGIFLYFLILVLLFLFQRKLQYVPMGEALPVAKYQLEGFEEIILTTEDETKILSWFKAPDKIEQKIVLYFHGNAGNLGDRVEKFRSFVKSGYGVMAISYRGYSGSEGSPSQQGLVNDARSAFKFLLDQGYLAKDIILYGESLGSGVAMQLAAKFDFDAVILESPFSSITSVAQRTYWFVPVKLLLRDKFDSIKLTSKISSPVLIIHGKKDEVVPYEEGQKLYNAIKGKKRFITVEEAGHVSFDDDFVVREVSRFLEEMESK